jgi:tRNA pseudouridine38-40 synthase
MRNIKLLIEYDGTNFAGWQRQPDKRTVQETIEKVLQKITQEKIHLIGASRTDAGVHALGQVANFHTKSEIPCRKFLTALNGLLPADVSVKKVEDVGAGLKPAPTSTFHANKDAKKKTYRYLIWNAKARSALLKNRAWHVWNPLNLKAIQKGVNCLVGRHDFSSFRGARSDTKTSVRTIYEIKVGRGNPPWLPVVGAGFPSALGGRKPAPLQIKITGNGFLKYMVRNIVGTLVEVGKGRLQPHDVGRILESKDRKKAAMTAPASGLYLEKISY